MEKWAHVQGQSLTAKVALKYSVRTSSFPLSCPSGDPSYLSLLTYVGTKYNNFPPNSTLLPQILCELFWPKLCVPY
jgi:hypothetical protein